MRVLKDTSRLPSKMLLLLLLLPPSSHALRFHSYFTPGLVLQREANNIIWGYDAIGKVEASFSCSGKNEREQKSLHSATVSAEGFWQVELPRRSSGMVCHIEASSATEQLVLDDLLIGDVWQHGAVHEQHHERHRGDRGLNRPVHRGGKRDLDNLRSRHRRGARPGLGTTCG